MVAGLLANLSPFCECDGAPTSIAADTLLDLICIISSEEMFLLNTDKKKSMGHAYLLADLVFCQKWV